MTTTAQNWINALHLTPHPEGGYFREMPHGGETITLPDGRERFHYTSICFLLTQENPSRFHRLKSDEVWYFHTGAPLTVHCLHPNGRHERIALGLRVEHGEVLQARMPAGVIFGAAVVAAGGMDFALVSCMVSPGFDYADFELCKRADLLAQYPAHGEIIRRLTPDS